MSFFKLTENEIKQYKLTEQEVKFVEQFEKMLNGEVEPVKMQEFLATPSAQILMPRDYSDNARNSRADVYCNKNA